MDYIKPPTDNLYKFIAISGLIILGYAVYFNEASISDLRIKTIEHETQKSILKVEIKTLEYNRSKIAETQKVDQNFFDCMYSQKDTVPNNNEAIYHSCLSKHPTDTKKMVKRYYEVNKLLNDYFFASQEIIKKTIIVDSEEKKVNFLVSRLHKFTNILYLIVIVGLSLLIYGFYNWYYRVQKPQDNLLLNELSNENKST